MQTLVPSPIKTGRLAPATRAVAIGTFDGVHRGHQAVVRSLVRTRFIPTVVTFDPHPRTFFGQDVPMVTSIERRIELLRAAGAHDVVVVPFSAEMAAQSPQEWVASTLVPIGTRVVAVGSDFRFGRGREGDVATLRKCGFEVHPTRLLPGVSSTEVRRLVQLGLLTQAAGLLGRRFGISTTIQVAMLTNNGGATLFLEPPPASALRPPDGAYWARIDGIPGLANFSGSRLRFVTPNAASGWRPGVRRELELVRRYGPA